MFNEYKGKPDCQPANGIHKALKQNMHSWGEKLTQRQQSTVDCRSQLPDYERTS